MKPVHFTIRVKENIAPIAEVRPEGEIASPIETALNAIKEVQKDHPNAKISVEVEV